MTNTHNKVANVDDIRGIHSSVSTHCYYLWWRSNVIVGSYEIRAEGGMG
jgi:hypothetical protein